MSKLSVDRFVELVERSKLIDPVALEELIAAWKGQATATQLDDADACAAYLVTSGALTDWQSKKLLEGRHRGFFLGKYKLLDHVGSGGMSSVYLAEHVLMQRRVAVKVLPQNRVSDASYLARFHFEAQVAAVLDHPNIVRVFDLDNDGRIHYLVMEYIEGYDLEELVAEQGPLDYHTAVEFVIQAAAGLEHAHQAGLVHRDIKPANLLVDMRGTLKILDMGLAKFNSDVRATPDFAQEEHVLGTADYLAPEQAVNSQTVDQRADIYGLGCTLYFLLAGRPPFATGTSQERMTAHQHEEPRSLLLERPDAPPALVAICRRMMEKSPSNRYQSASEVRQALEAWLESEAAFGRVAPPASLACGRTKPGTRWRAPAGSGPDLVRGSGSDLRDRSGDSESRHVFSPLADTDPNLIRGTTKIPRPSTKPPSELLRPSRGSDVLSFGPGRPSGSPTGLGATPPAPPPIVAPPVSVGRSQTVAPPGEFAASHGPVFPPRPPHVRAPRASNWPWIVLVTTLLLGALVLALTAL